MPPNKKYTGTWYTNQYKQQYCTSTYIVYVLTTGTVDHEQVWQPYAVDPYYSAISKWWPYSAGRPGSSEVPRNPLTRWDVSSIPANGIFLANKTQKQK